jgi:phage terminase large subunit-like protein
MGARPAWSTACPDWGDRLRGGRSIIPPPIFASEAERALAIFKELRVVDLPGRPTFGECADQWVFDFVAAVFGAYDSETGQQLIREFYLLISKKNTKSTIAAGIMLTALILCWREEEEHLILAPTVEVAGNSFKPAAAMVRADEELAAMFHVQDHVRTITHRVTRNSLKVVAAESETVSGKKSGKVLVDEHWLFGKRAGAEAMFLEALGGQVSRDEGWVIFLTTQSDEAPAGVFKEKLDYFRSVRDGKIVDPRSLGVLYEFPESMIEAKAYMDPANFHITNPNLGRSVSSQWLQDQLRKLEARTDGAFQQFLAKHLNIEIGLRLMAGRWPGADHWQGAARVGSLPELIDRSDVITMGIDGGGLDDWLAASALGRDKDTGCWLHWGRAWVHPVAMERRKVEAARWADFMAQGDLVLVERIGQDIDGVAEMARELDESGLLTQVGVDPIGISDIEAALIDIGIDKDADGKDRIVGIPQGYKLSGTINTVARRLVEGKFAHAGQPVMAWAVGNAKVEARGNAVIVTKQAAGACKIDLLVSLFNAAALMALAPEPDVCTDEEVLAA